MKKLFYWGLLSLSAISFCTSCNESQRDYAKELKSDISATKKAINSSSYADFELGKRNLSQLGNRVEKYYESPETYLSFKEYLSFIEDLKELEELVEEKEIYSVPQMKIDVNNDELEIKAKKNEKYLKDFKKYSEESISYLKKSFEAFGKNDFDKAIDIYEKYCVNSEISKNLQNKLCKDDIEAIAKAFKSDIENLNKQIDLSKLIDKKDSKLNKEQQERLEKLLSKGSFVSDMYDSFGDTFSDAQEKIGDMMEEGASMMSNEMSEPQDEDE